MTDEPVHDRALALTLTGSQADLADELLGGLLRTLPHTLQTLQQAASLQDTETLRHAIHRLRGLICYCGTPRLQLAAKNLETTLGQPSENFTGALAHFFREAAMLLELFSSEA